MTGETNATVWVGVTSVGQSYGVVSESFTNRNIVLYLYGGIEVGTQNMVGRSAIRGTGSAGLSIGVTDPVNYTNCGQFVLCNFDVDTNYRALQNSVAFTRRRTCCWYTLSNCVFRTSSTTEPVVYFAVGDYGLAPEAVTCYGTSLATTSSSTRAAFYVESGGNQRNQVTMIQFVDGCYVRAAADGSAATRLAAIEQGWSHLVIQDSEVINEGPGWCVYGGRESYGGYNHTNHFIRSTFTSNGGGIYLLNNVAAPSYMPNRFIESTLSAVGPYGLYLRGFHGANPAGLGVWVVSNSVISVTSDGGIGFYFGRNNGGILTARLAESTIHGNGRACYLFPGGGGNAGDDTAVIVRCQLTAGSSNGSANSTNEVVRFASYKSTYAHMNDTVIRNGLGGVALVPGQRARLTMVNCAVVDQSDYGVILDSGGNYDERLHATNCTFSAIGSRGIVFGDNGTSTTLAGTLRYCAFVLGTNATVFINEDADRNVTLDGMTNAFYRYATFSSGGVTDNLQGSILEPTGDPKFGKDGYHLFYGSPLMNRYSLVGKDPVTDIDGETRPHQTYADIGCDEAVLPPPRTFFIVR